MRNTCFSCSKTHLKEVLDLGDLHLPRFTTYQYELSPKFPLKLLFCPDCKLVQLDKVTPRELLYDENYGYRSGVNDTMRDHLKEIVKSTENFITLEENDIVIDIGANDGTLLLNYPDYVTKVAVDPVRKFSDELQIKGILGDKFKYIFDYFTYKPTISRFFSPAKVITAIAMFYDLQDPNKFLADIDKTLDEKGVCIIQQNYLVSMLNNNAYDNIIHEHVTYFSFISFENLLKNHDLEVIDVSENDLNGGSFRTTIAHKGVFNPKESVESMRQYEEAIDWYPTLKVFAQTVRETNEQLHDFLKDKKNVYIYGASNRGNTIVQSANLVKFFDGAAERNPEKYGKYFLGVPIVSEEEAREKADYFLVLPYFFKKEIIEREKGGRQKLIFPLPEFEVI